MTATREGMLGKDWDAVARAINERMTRLDLSAAELTSRASVSPETIRELRYNLKPRRRNPRTLAAISEALGWEPGHLSKVLDSDGAAEVQPFTSADLDELRRAFTDLAGRLEAIERRLDTE